MTKVKRATLLILFHSYLLYTQTILTPTNHQQICAQFLNYTFSMCRPQAAVQEVRDEQKCLKLSSRQTLMQSKQFQWGLVIGKLQACCWRHGRADVCESNCLVAYRQISSIPPRLTCITTSYCSSFDLSERTPYKRDTCLPTAARLLSYKNYWVILTHETTSTVMILSYSWEGVLLWSVKA